MKRIITNKEGEPAGYEEETPEWERDADELEEIYGGPHGDAPRMITCPECGAKLNAEEVWECGTCWMCDTEIEI